MWSKYGKFIVTFLGQGYRAVACCRAALCLRAASEPRSMFTPGVFQHHHLLATRAAQRLTAGTWVFGREYMGAGRVCAVSESQAVHSSPPSSPGRCQSQANRGPADAHCFKNALCRARDVYARPLSMYTGHVSHRRANRPYGSPLSSVCVDCKYWYPSTYLIFIARTTGTF